MLPPSACGSQGLDLAQLKDKSILDMGLLDFGLALIKLPRLTVTVGKPKKTLGGVLPEWVVVLTGSVLAAFAAFCFAAAVWRELYPGAPPPRPAPPPAGIAVRVERLPCASGARRAARRLVWTHRRELTTAIGPRELLQVS
jgi:hypothetical protein